MTSKPSGSQSDTSSRTSLGQARWWSHVFDPPGMVLFAAGIGSGNLRHFFGGSGSQRPKMIEFFVLPLGEE